MSADTYELESVHAALGRVWAALGDLAPDELGKDIAEIVSGRLSRSHREAETGVAVKPLEWTFYGGGGRGYDEWLGRGFGVSAIVYCKREKFEYHSQIFSSLDEAKEAAQADFQGLIRSALASPQRETEGREITEKMVERARNAYVASCEPLFIDRVRDMLTAALQSVQERT